MPCGDIFPADEISMYKTMRVDPINPKYRIPSSACAERMAPEFPAGIVYSSIKPRRPHAIGNVVFRPPGGIGLANDAAPIAALAIKPAKAQTLSVAAINCTRASLPCCRAMKPGTVTDRSRSSALAHKGAHWQSQPVDQIQTRSEHRREDHGRPEFALGTPAKELAEGRNL
jgi:hypothetical protein